MINTLLRNWHAFKRICAEEQNMLAHVNDCVLQANTAIKDYKAEYDKRLAELEEAVSAINIELPDESTQLGSDMALEMEVCGLGTLAGWERALDEISFEPYPLDEIQDIEPQTLSEQQLDKVMVSIERLELVLDLKRRFSPPDGKDPFAPTIQEGIDPAAGAGESMVSIKEADLRMLVSVIQQYLPVR